MVLGGCLPYQVPTTLTAVTWHWMKVKIVNDINYVAFTSVSGQAPKLQSMTILIMNQFSSSYE